MIPKSDLCDEKEHRKNVCELYRELVAAKVDDIKQNVEELKFFRTLYTQELLSSTGAVNTLEIIKKLEEKNDQDKAEYLRLKAISVSGIVA